MDMKYVYGPVPSRRLGISLGISPIPKKTCNYSCIYCQLGRTDKMTNTRQMFFPVKDIIKEFDDFLKKDVSFDVVTIVGEGEPSLYLGLGSLISEIKERTSKPVAVITNGALLYDADLRDELNKADIVLPTLDAYDEDTFSRINRAHKNISFKNVSQGLKAFSKEYKGQLWIEIMLVKGINDDDESLKKYKSILSELKYDRLYINTPVRPPAESDVEAIDNERMKTAVEILNGISIDLLESEGFYSEISDDLEAIVSIIKRHPMNQFEVEGFLESRNCPRIKEIVENLRNDERMNVINYKGYDTFRLK
ncbi:radical SAM protein [Proteocatella sphenisci]|uniref:radical SAM protein n=1 Tax=Proteocatella sphenisci TaxID=181070 RepID=UPI00048AAF1F|nr:radical SAM protein [Proteocatella sphenisci]